MTNDQRRASLLARMRRHNITSAEFAAVLKVKPQTVRAWRCGVRAVPKYVLELISPRPNC